MEGLFGLRLANAANQYGYDAAINQQQAQAGACGQLGGANSLLEWSKIQQAQIQAAQEAAMQRAKQKQSEKTMNNGNELIPDISVTRVLKWAVVLLIAMGLGRRVWGMFGDKITANMHKALDTIGGDSKP